MNNVITTLKFRTQEMAVRSHEGQPWLTLSDIEKALGYTARGTALARVYSRHADEFTDRMTAMLEVVTAGGRQFVRFFSLRGAHLLAMFARTPVAKEFRRWVLDILDEEVRAESVRGKRLAPDVKERIAHLCHEVAYIRSWWDHWAPAFREINQKGIAAPAHDHVTMATAWATGLVRDMGLPDPFPQANRYSWLR